MKSPRAHLIRDAERLAVEQGGILRLRDLAGLGLTVDQRVAQVAARRWEPISGRGVVVGRLGEDSPYWRAVVEVGAGAAIGGASALFLAGLTGWRQERIQVWVPKSFSKDRHERRVVDVDLHETRRWTRDDWVGTGMPRSTPAVAAVQAALWSMTARQAATIWAMAVQQRIVSPADLGEEFGRVRRHRLRKVLTQVLGDISDGVHSINELDFAQVCRAWGLPEPTRQVAKRTEQGRIYLDVYWDAYGIRVEINGAHHGQLSQMVKDEVRAIQAQTAGDAAVSISVLTLRTAPDEVMRAIAGLLRSRGWSGSLRAASA